MISFSTIKLCTISLYTIELYATNEDTLRELMLPTFVFSVLRDPKLPNRLLTVSVAIVADSAVTEVVCSVLMLPSPTFIVLMLP
jgi:hypothetical protein